MKEIDGKLYGYASELGQNAPEDDLIEFHAVDTGTIFLSYNGQWYEQRDAKWAKSLVSASSGGGGGSGGLMIGADNVSGLLVLDKTWQEIHDAMPFAVLADEVDPGVYEYAPCAVCDSRPEQGMYYCVFFTSGGNEWPFATDSADGYPEEFSEGGNEAPPPGGDEVDNQV